MNVCYKEVNYVKIKCRCGHSLWFLKAFPQRCSNCGRVVTPVRKNDFIDNLMKAREKNEQSS